MVGRKPRLTRQARTITIRGGEEVYTRLSKREYEQRHEQFDNPDLGYNKPEHLERYDYEDWVSIGASGGRPRKWTSQAERMRAQRAQQRLAAGQPLTPSQKELLGLVKKRPGAYRTSLGRPLTPAERKARWRARKGLSD